MAAALRKVETIDRYSHDELIQFLTSMIPVVTVFDKVKNAADSMTDKARKDYEGKRDSYYRSLTFAIFLIVTGVGILGVLPQRYLWICLIPICTGLILIPIALKKKQTSETLLNEIPGMEKKSEELTEGLGQMREEYGEELRLIPNEYRHANELSYFIEHLKNSNDSIADIAEEYEIEKHTQIIQDLQQRQAEQQERRADYERKTEILRTVKIVEATRALEEWRGRYKPIKDRNNDLRNIVSRHNENPDDVLREVQ
ncbi:hypothetical protein [Bifidobacterium sp. ESL0745]|uniref:hypothetical protein n=1 Tax=Bifidobacterium sp. ESL0745 TaxID=2983226 RepID=UPI0023F8FCC2|nr:hypothetical protein [Bifidobacterium sp. ESL0745]MDF7665260.1 hypothetical protein [Bifidobacterium sp. ESL0745]